MIGLISGKKSSSTSFTMSTSPESLKVNWPSSELSLPLKLKLTTSFLSIKWLRPVTIMIIKWLYNLWWYCVTFTTLIATSCFALTCFSTFLQLCVLTLETTNNGANILPSISYFEIKGRKISSSLGLEAEGGLGFFCPRSFSVDGLPLRGKW